MSEVTEDQRGPLINVAIWITVSAMAITVLSKLYIKFTVIRRLQIDDYLISTAALLAIGQSIAVSEEVSYGLGRHESTLSKSQVESVLKTQYASAIMYLATIFISKIADFAFFVILIGPLGKRPVTLIRAAAAFCLVWMLAGIFVLGFQCELPRPWDYGSSRCLNKPAYWTVTAVVDIVTQILISFIPAYLLRDLHASRGRRYFSMFAFTPNLLTIALVILRVYYIYKIDGSGDRTWDWYDAVLVTSIHTQFSVLLAAMPFLKPLIDSMVVLPAVIPDDESTVIASDSFGTPLKGQARKWTQSLSVFTVRSSSEPIQRSQTVVEAVDVGHREQLSASNGAQGAAGRMGIMQTKEFAVTS